jgi:predicted alpha/beta superfamily hydrolase
MKFPSNRQDQIAEATIFSTEVRDITSSIHGMDYKLSVWLPHDYSRSTRKYPVLYVLDANVCFGMAAESVWSLMLGKEIPDMLVVGIGYRIRDIDDWSNRRTYDFTPTPHVGIPGSGGAEMFVSTLKNDIMPFLEESYRVDLNDSAIFGYSLGGLFAMFALLFEPGLFSRYVAGSPALHWDDGIIFEYEDSLATSRRQLSKNCFLSVGSRETQFLPFLKKFYDRLNERHYEGLNLTMQVFDGETHASSPAFSLVRGVKSVFSSS